MDEALQDSAIPDGGYRELFETIAEVLEYDPKTGNLRLPSPEKAPEAKSTLADLENRLQEEHGYTTDELGSLERLVREDVIRMNQELDDITPEGPESH